MPVSAKGTRELVLPARLAVRSRQLEPAEHGGAMQAVKIVGKPSPAQKSSVGGLARISRMTWATERLRNCRLSPAGYDG